MSLECWAWRGRRWRLRSWCSAPGTSAFPKMQAGIKPKIVQPKFTSQGCEFTLKTGKPEYQAGESPVVELTATNPTGKAVEAKVWVSISDHRGSIAAVANHDDPAADVVEAVVRKPETGRNEDDATGRRRQADRQAERHDHHRRQGASGHGQGIAHAPQRACEESRGRKMNTSHHPWPYRIPLGIALGLAASAVVLAMLPGGGDGRGRPEGGKLLSECDGAIREVVIHYVPEAADVVAPTYRDFLRQLPADVIGARRVPRSSGFRRPGGAGGADRMRALAGHRRSPDHLLVARPVAGVAAGRQRRSGPCCFVRGPKTAPTSGRIGQAIGRWPPTWPRRFVPNVSVLPSDLYFDGGDVAADGETAFVTPAMPLRNIQRTVQDAEELRERLAAVLGRRVVLLQGAPDHHTAMYMTPVGNRTVLVGDPALARRIC